MVAEKQITLLLTMHFTLVLCHRYLIWFTLPGDRNNGDVKAEVVRKSNQTIDGLTIIHAPLP